MGDDENKIPYRVPLINLILVKNIEKRKEKFNPRQYIFKYFPLDFKQPTTTSSFLSIIEKSKNVSGIGC
jgi:hypothetical protein